MKTVRRTTIKKWTEEAAAYGWEFMSQVDSSQGEYRHLHKNDGSPCGALKIAQATNMRKGSVRCDTCQAPALEWIDTARSKGWEFICQVDGARANYRHEFKPDGTPCGSSKIAQMTHMRADNGVSCDVCHDPALEWAATAMAKGWAFIRKVDGNRAEYCHVTKADGTVCGALKIAQAASMRAGQGIRCDVCQGPRARTFAPRSQTEKVGPNLVRANKSPIPKDWELVRKINKDWAEFRHIQKDDGSPCGALKMVSPSQARRGSVRCVACQDPIIEWAASALAAGWELSRKVDGSKAEYRHIHKADRSICGGMRISEAANMRKGTVRCEACQSPVLEWAATADAKGWKFVRKVERNRAEYRHVLKSNGTPCGALKISTRSNMRSLNGVRCDACQDPILGWVVSAEKTGWELVQKVNAMQAEFRHTFKDDGTPCGGIKIFDASQMRQGSVRCDACQASLLEWASSAKKMDWEFVRKVDSHRAEFRHLHRPDGSHCGATKVAQPAQMRIGTVQCPICGDPYVSRLHQQVRFLLESMVPEGIQVKEEFHIGLKPSITEDGDDGAARADFGINFGSRRFVLEIDGEQHFRLAPYFHQNEGEFIRQVHRDVFVELDAADQGMIVLRFGSWEDIGIVESILRETFKSEHKTHRVAENLPLEGIKIHPKFWAWRKEARDAYRRRIDSLARLYEPKT